MKPIRIASASLSVFYFCSQVLLASAPETNFWKQRRSQIEQRDMLASAQFASVPSQISSVVAAQPGLNQSLSSTSSLSSTASRSDALDPVLREIPQNVASLQQVFLGKSPTAAPVLLIQDVHMNAEAQKNIATVLQTLVDKKLTSAIAIEGAFEPLALQPLRELPRPDLTRQVAQSFLDNGMLAAPSYVGITSPTEPPMVVGVDDEPHYNANVQAYLDSRAVKPALASDLRNQRQHLVEQKKKVFSAALLRFDELRTAHQSGALGLGAYIERMSRLQTLQEPALLSFLQAYRLEKSLNFSQAERDRKRVLEKLTPTLSAAELKELVDQSAAYKLGRLSFGTYYANFRALCAQKQIDLTATPAFDAYIRYVLLADGLKSESIFAAIESEESRLAQQLTTTADERALLDQTIRLDLTVKLIAFELTAREWTRYTLLPEFKRVPDLDSFERFYREADVRSKHITKRVLTLAAEQKPVVLIVGGFHTSEITELLKAADRSFAVVSPKITRIDTTAGSAYLSVFAREKTSLDQLFTVEKLFVCPTIVHARKQTWIRLWAITTSLTTRKPFARLAWSKIPKALGWVTSERISKLRSPSIMAI